MIQDANRVAIDIETVSPDLEYWERPNFRDSKDFELLAVALAWRQNPGPDIQTRVLFRDGWGSDSELALIENTVTWLEAAEAEIYITYNGETFDFRHLRGRCHIAAEEAGTGGALRERVEASLSAAESVDLKHDAWAAFGDYTALGTACARVGVAQETPHWQDYPHGLDPDETRVECDKGTPTLLSSDVAQFGERYLDWCDRENANGERLTALKELLQTYARADVVPLFELADARPYV
ncbi:3'-5' exonuclease [Salinigranum sp. GCM10025319]|uniref:3'-5' exonuclease n=1 Tax=Salinigranum sp. GCM10025319 TaxID=3252687 RepID=UPI003608F4BF